LWVVPVPASAPLDTGEGRVRGHLARGNVGARETRLGAQCGDCAAHPRRDRHPRRKHEAGDFLRPHLAGLAGHLEAVETLHGCLLVEPVME